MKILHTSDWHLGHKLYGRQRYHEFSAFLHWLLETINDQRVDALVVAGDIFDSQTPSNRSLSLYYRFLSAVSTSCCHHVIITGGNHDSPTLLNAPRELLSFLNIHIVGSTPDNPEDEVILLQDSDGQPELMVLATPYLRDRDIRSSTMGESLEDKQQKLLQGICDHYARLCTIAEKRQKNLPGRIPLLATGHLFCRGGKTRHGDGLRDLYVGSLVHVGLDCFPESIDYLALGHLHTSQRVQKHPHRRYSGAPLPMSFQEAAEQKVVLLVEMEEKTEVSELPVPCFQVMKSLSGTLEELLLAIQSLATLNQSILLEIDYNGERLVNDLQEQLYSAIQGTELEVLRIRNKRIYDHVLQRSAPIKSLDELTPEQVFLQCLETRHIPDSQRNELLSDFARVLSALVDSETEISTPQ